MESRIKVAVDFQNGNQPVIHIVKKQSEDDVRDALLGSFIDGFPDWNNRWAKVVYQGEDMSKGVDSQSLHYYIIPLSEKDLAEEMNLMTAYLKHCEEKRANDIQGNPPSTR